MCDYLEISIASNGLIDYQSNLSFDLRKTVVGEVAVQENINSRGDQMECNQGRHRCK